MAETDDTNLLRRCLSYLTCMASVGGSIQPRELIAELQARLAPPAPKPSAAFRFTCKNNTYYLCERHAKQLTAVYQQVPHKFEMQPLLASDLHHCELCLFPKESL